MSPFPNSPLARLRRLGLGLLLLAVPACGLSDYEARMLDAQEREKRFLEEEKYLDNLVQMPTKKVKLANEKKERDVAVADVFFRPPKGIGAKPSPQPRDIPNADPPCQPMWMYSASQRDSEFTSVEMAFADNEKDFAEKVLRSYAQFGQPKNLPPRQIARPDQQPVAFDRWEFNNGPYGYSVNIVRGRTKPVAIVYVYKKAHLDLVEKAIELSLRTLTFDQQMVTVRKRYDRKSPWELRPAPTP